MMNDSLVLQANKRSNIDFGTGSDTINLTDDITTDFLINNFNVFGL